MKSYQLHHVLYIIAFMFAAVFGLLWLFYYVIPEPFPSEEYYILLIMYAIMLMATALIFKTKNLSKIHSSIGFNPVKLNAIIIATASALFIWFIDYIYQTKVLNIDNSIGANIWYKQQANLVYVFLSTAIITPVIEEMLFRGIILQSLRNHLSKTVSAIIVSALFTLIHFEVLQIPILFLASIIYVWLTYKYKSIIPAIIAHIINNCLTFFYYISIIGI